MTKVTNISNWPVMKSKCPTYPFNEDENGSERSPDVVAIVKNRCLTTASQICHHPKLKGKKQDHLCRGARDFQLQIFHRLGFLDDQTDDAWARKMEELGTE